MKDFFGTIAAFFRKTWVCSLCLLLVLALLVWFVGPLNSPRQIPFHSGKTYFALELSSEELAQLERSGGFAFHVSGEFTGLELKFWAIRNSL